MKTDAFALILTLVPTSLATAGIPAMTAANVTRPCPPVPLAPSPLPVPGPARDGAEIARQLTTLSRSDVSRLVKLVKKVRLEGDLWEPEGIVRLARPGAAEDEERFWVSAGEYTVPTEKYPDGDIIDGTDRTAGAGFAHLVVFDGRGTRLGDWVVSEEGDLEVRLFLLTSKRAREQESKQAWQGKGDFGCPSGR